MRVVDLDRDMSDVFPTGSQPDSEFLFARMEAETLSATGCVPGARIVDVAAGVGQDARTLAARGARVAGAEPSSRMTELARIADAKAPAIAPGSLDRVRAWSESLPFRSGAFDAAYCKGALDHFDDPEACLREMARVTRRGGRVVLAVANFDSLGVRISRQLDRLRGSLPEGRRHYDVPSDHFTRYDPELLERQLERLVQIDRRIGVSLLWGVRGWARLLAWLGPRASGLLLRAADRVAARFPALADIIVLAGSPRPADRTSGDPP
ncbi:MAG: methyltransferase domain-containing protein [Myxococcota bacterium]